MVEARLRLRIEKRSYVSRVRVWVRVRVDEPASIYMGRNQPRIMQGTTLTEWMC